MRAIACLVLATSIAACQSPSELTTSTADPSAWPELPLSIVDVHIEGDSLFATVQHGGGCGEHAYALESSGPMMKSLPPKQPLRWVHRSPGDPCRALIQQNVAASLLPFRGTPRGITLIQLEGWEEALPYTYP